LLDQSGDRCVVRQLKSIVVKYNFHASILTLYPRNSNKDILSQSSKKCITTGMESCRAGPPRRCRTFLQDTS
jgi:hypothetical protein